MQKFCHHSGANPNEESRKLECVSTKHTLCLCHLPKCNIIKFSFFAFQHDHISVEHDEKNADTKFHMNRFMGARDMTA